MTTKANVNTSSAAPKEQKRVLGRGLSALISSAPVRTEAGFAEELEQTSTGLLQIPLLNIGLNPYQPRASFSPEQLLELTESIKQHGVLQPIVVRPKGKNTYELVAGERRFRAATSAGLSEIPAIVKKIDNRTSLAIAIIENIQRQELNPVESARAYRRLMTEFGLTQTELALEVGKSQPAVANSIRILALPEPILDSLSKGEISEGHAKVILSLEAEPSRLELWNSIVSGSLSVRETERRASAMKTAIPRGIAAGSQSERPKSDMETARIEEQLSLALGTKVKIRFSGRDKGQIEVQFYGLDQLDGLISTLSGQT